jgi:glutathione peroxidase
MIPNTIHAFQLESIEGGAIDMAAFQGKKILLVNVASECGYTPQYAQMQELHEQMSDHLVVIGVPCNDFGGQEPGSGAEIQQFCTRRYGVAFPLTAKIVIKGEQAHPLYAWLTQKSQNGVQDSTVTWNFQKYLLDEQGRLVAVYPPSLSVFDIPDLM